MPSMDYSLIQRTPDGTGKILVTTPGSPDTGSYVLESDMKTFVNNGMLPEYATDPSKWDTTPTNGSTKPVTSDGVYDAMSALGDRVDAIEETLMGENEVTVQYPDDGNYSSLMPNKVPLRALKFAEVPRFRGKSRAWNQLIRNGNFADSSSWGVYAPSRSSLSFSGGVLTQTINDTTGSPYEFGLLQNSVFNNRASLYLVYIELEPSFQSRFCIELGGGANHVTDELPANKKSTIAFVGNMDQYNASILIYPYGINFSIGDTVKYYKVFARDVSLIFSEYNNTQIRNLGVSGLVALCSDLLKYDAYDAGAIKNTIYSGAKSTSRNLLDESAYDDNIWIGTDGTEYAMDGKRTYIIDAVKPLTNYIFKAFGDVAYFDIIEYDQNWNYLYGSGGVGSAAEAGWAFQTNSSAAKKLKISVYNKNVTELMFTEGTSIPSEYEPHLKDSISLPSPVTLRGVGTCEETLDPETGMLDDGKFGSADLGSLSWNYDSSEVWFYTSDLSAYIKYNTENLLCPLYSPHYDLGPGHGDMLISVNSGGYIKIANSSYTDAATFKAAMSGVYLLYEKATYTPSSPITPVPYNFLEVEGGGTVETIQTQTPVIDNCLDVTYDIIPQ